MAKVSTFAERRQRTHDNSLSHLQTAFPNSAIQTANRRIGADSSFRIPSMVFDDNGTDSTNNTSPTADPSRSSPTRNIPGAVRRVSGSIDVLSNGNADM